MQNKPVYYLQDDPRWGSIIFSNHNDSSQTIASSGCGATCMAMVLATFLDENITPPDVAKVIVDNGYRTYDDGVDWAFFLFASEYYGLEFKLTYSTDDVIEALKNSALVIASMGPGYFTNYGHYILLWGLDEVNERILVNDPNSTVKTQASYDLFREQSANYFIFYEPEESQMAEQWKLDIIKEAKQAGLITVDHDPDETAPKWFVLKVLLNALKTIK
ncbi:MAG: hypothetical protein A4E52_01361 [Pelotomaculum sp. PtaB.Bin013]|uniref:C39 family peptidase n=1 Tax=Pelotomaculum isophthalicicum JI TaxID=947010 RepID=A0A9X4H079_9FIRM|nr:C39 family peptidase [Pelotomaculum isophthalicicum]MDF9407005.1 C39 family peptidase [Pelotomaculum isophthalicicum JI]OPX87537.1 MAG: hypothetical protein A4E52_01361 [Pelotomaculum sp. PtaB.Bin013]